MSTERRVADFLTALATDSDRLARFMSSRGEASTLMDAAGLGPDSQRALASRDLGAVHAALKAESPGVLGVNSPPEMGPGGGAKKKKKRKGGKKRPPGKPGKPKPPGRKKPGSRKKASRPAARKR